MYHLTSLPSMPRATRPSQVVYTSSRPHPAKPDVTVRGLSMHASQSAIAH